MDSTNLDPVVLYHVFIENLHVHGPFGVQSRNVQEAAYHTDPLVSNWWVLTMISSTS